MIEVETTKVNIKELKAAPYNPRKISDKAYQGLKTSVERFGLVQPIIINKQTGYVVGGHQRLKALEDLGYLEVDVVKVDLTESEEKALNIALNSQAISGEFTDDLQALLDEVKTELPEDYDKLLLAELEGKTEEIKEKELDENISTDNQCPSCGYEW